MRQKPTKLQQYNSGQEQLQRQHKIAHPSDHTFTARRVRFKRRNHEYDILHYPQNCIDYGIVRHAGKNIQIEVIVSQFPSGHLEIVS